MVLFDKHFLTELLAHPPYFPPTGIRHGSMYSEQGQFWYVYCERLRADKRSRTPVVP